MIALDIRTPLHAYGGKMVANVEFFSDYEPLNIGKINVCSGSGFYMYRCRMMKRMVILNENRQRKTE